MISTFHLSYKLDTVWIGSSQSQPARPAPAAASIACGISRSPRCAPPLSRTRSCPQRTPAPRRMPPPRSSRSMSPALAPAAAAAIPLAIEAAIRSASSTRREPFVGTARVSLPAPRLPSPLQVVLLLPCQLPPRSRRLQLADLAQPLRCTLAFRTVAAASPAYARFVVQRRHAYAHASGTIDATIS